MNPLRLLATALRVLGITEGDVYVADSRAEVIMRVPGARVWGGSSDTDLVMAIPEEMSSQQWQEIENKAQLQLSRHGIDFTFVDANELKKGGACGRVVVKVGSIEG